jgi:3-deoxy-7-phosphoheptulonate synthase
MSAEYIMASGNSRVILCERGIRTFETMTRNTPGPVRGDRAQAEIPPAGDCRPQPRLRLSFLCAPLSKAALAVGADGLMIEAHNDPKNALCDGAQSLDLKQFNALMSELRKRVCFENRIM